MADYTLTADADVFPGNADVSGDDRIYGPRSGDDILAGDPGAYQLDGGEGSTPTPTPTPPSDSTSTQCRACP